MGSKAEREPAAVAKNISAGKKKIKAKQGSSSVSPVAHQIGSLLHTMRSIQQHEQELCTLKHHFERESSPGPEVMEDLRQLLESMPTRDYLDDLDALHDTVGQGSGSKKQKP